MIEQPKTTLQVCYNHPNRETLLRCNRCDRPICTECAVLTPTGYRCKECVRGQQKSFETARWIDYPVVIVIAAALSVAGSYISSMLGFFTIFLAPVAGVIIAEAIRWAIRKRRSRALYRTAAVFVALGGLWLPLVHLINLLGGSYFDIMSLIWSSVYVILSTSSAYYRLSGIQIR